MSYLCKWIFVITVLQLIVISSSQDIGKVHIGVKGGSSTAVFSHNRNADPQKLKIYIEITNPANPTQNVALRDTVNINCESSDIRPGYSIVTFQPIVITAGTPLNRTITYTVTSSGRAVDIRCYGQSNGLSCPVNSSAAASPPQPQFCKSTSISAPVSMTVRPAPLVSFCSPSVSVPNNMVTTSTFTLTLSETVEDNDVDIACSMVPSSKGMNVSIKTKQVSINASKQITVSYDINKRGSSTDVQCSANSQGGGTQYKTNTSKGKNSKAKFVLSAGSVTLIPAVTSAYSSILKGFLTLDGPDPGISFTCRAVVIDSLALAHQLVKYPSCSFSLTSNTTTTTTTTTTPPTTTTAANGSSSTSTTPTTPDLTSTWIMDESSFAFEKDETYKVVIARRQQEVVDAVRELVVTTCCVRSSTAKYFNMSAAMLSALDLTPEYCANCTGGPTSSTLTSERVIQNVAFREVAPCPCDLTYSVCDTHCCCDTECSADTKKTFTYCIPGPYGGQRDLVHLHMCQSNRTFKEDWFPLTCVQFETNAFLGLFYGNTAVLTELAYSARLAEQKPFFSYRETERRYMDPNSEYIGYKDGASIRTGKALKSIPTVKRGILTLPSRSVGGACLRTMPVRFQRDRTSNCVVAVLGATCRFDSVLSATMYAESTTKSKPPCPHAYSVLQKYGGNDIVIADTFVSYYCAVNDTEYVKSSRQYVMSPTELVTFSPELSAENCTHPCEDPICIQYNENLYSTPSLPPRCPWDDGFTQPEIPVLNGNLCSNVVVSVSYRFTWTGDMVVKLNASVILAPVTVNPTPSLMQTFDVKFEHKATSSSNDTDNYDKVKGAYDRSGKPGYDFGKPLISGCPVYDSATSEFQSVDRSPSRQMAIFEPSQDGLCNTATRRPLKFGEDMVSSCKLRLNINELNNCTDLKQLLLNHLSVLMPADMIGRQGSNDPKNSTMWITVLRDIPSLNDTTGVENVTVNNSTGNFTEDVYMPVDNIRGICFNVTNEINLVVLYGDAGLANDYPIREVVGARVSYTRTNWSMSCRGADALRCRNNSQYVETFLLTSTVTFIKVPAFQPQPVIKFYTSKDPSCTTDTCARYYQDFDQSVCHFDTCWSQLLYPLSASYGADPPRYTLGVSLLLVLFIIGYFMVTRPWF